MIVLFIENARSSQYKDQQKMFGMDMGFGADMMGMGAMDMGLGAMQMGMGYDMMGAEMMAVGALDVGLGMGMMDQGYGYGYGMMGADMMAMNMGGMGICPPGCMRTCCRPIAVCPPGCMRTCCRPVVVCPPGCSGPCCINKQVIVRQVPVNQYSNNDGFVKLPPIPQRMNPPINRTYGGNDAQDQSIASEQARIERQKQEQLLYKQKLEQEQLALERQRLQFQQKQLQQQRLDQQRMEQIKEKQRLERLRKQQQELQKQAFREQYNNGNNESFGCEPMQPNPYEQNKQLLFQGNIHKQNFDKWQQINCAQLTIRTFLNYNIDNIRKIKVKWESQVPNTRLIKLTIEGAGDIMISVLSQEQADWMCKIIWARLNRMGKSCNINQPFVGCVQGDVIRKSFFSGWQLKYGSISSAGLKLFNNQGGSTSHIITSVPEIWTRFDIVHGNMLIVKMHHQGRKNEIGIPIDHAMAWLKGLYTLVRA